MARDSTAKTDYRDGADLHELNSTAVPTHLHATEVIPRPDFYHSWEHLRPIWLQEIAGEFFGVFFYTYAGIGSAATYTVGLLSGQSTLGSILQVSFAYAIGIILAITVCAMSSGGHFNPPVTIAFWMYRGFPGRKVPYFILAQILGAFCAALVVYGSWRETLIAVEAGLELLGKQSIIFTPEGTAGIFALYAPAGVNLKWVFMNEFFADFFIGLVIWGVLDPSNVFVSPASIPALIGFAYFVAIAGFSPNGLAANPARDMGARLMVISVWGKQGWGGSYAALSFFTAFPATLLAATVYEFILYDSSRVITSGSREFITNSDRHREHKAYKYNLRANMRRDRAASNASSSGFGVRNRNNRNVEPVAGSVDGEKGVSTHHEGA